MTILVSAIPNRCKWSVLHRQTGRRLEAFEMCAYRRTKNIMDKEDNNNDVFTKMKTKILLYLYIDRVSTGP